MRKARREWVRHFLVFQKACQNGKQAKSQRNLWFVSKISPKQPGLYENSHWINCRVMISSCHSHHFDASFFSSKKKRAARLMEIITLSHIVIFLSNHIWKPNTSQQEEALVNQLLSTKKEALMAFCQKKDGLTFEKKRN